MNSCFPSTLFQSSVAPQVIDTTSITKQQNYHFHSCRDALSDQLSSNPYLTKPQVCPYLLKDPKSYHKNKFRTSDPRQTYERVPEYKMAFNPNFLLFCLHLFPSLCKIYFFHYQLLQTIFLPCLHVSFLLQVSDAIYGFDHTCPCQFLL